MTRNQEGDHGTTRSIGQDGEDTKREKQHKGLTESHSHRTTSPYRTSDACRFSEPGQLQPWHPTAPGRPPHAGRLTLVSHPTIDSVRISGATCPEKKCQKSEDFQTYRYLRATGRPLPTGRLVPSCMQILGPRPMYPFRLSLTPSWI